MALWDRIKNSWNAFSSDEKNPYRPTPGPAALSYSRPDRTVVSFRNDRSIISAIYNRLSIDVANVPLKHVYLDKQGRYLRDAKSGLNECLTIEANIDQGGTHFRQDLAWNLFNHGVVAVVPVDTVYNPYTSNTYDISSLRVGQITEWFPQHVRVKLYNEKTAKFQEVTLPKKFVAIVENPFYNVMNSENSTLQRLARKLSLLDQVDEQTSSGKLDMIIQLPYTIKSEARRNQAEERRKDIEMQLKGSKFGIAYTDSTERITQLNRPIENNLLKQVEYLTGQLYAQLGISEEVFKGVASEAVMTHYYNQTIEPVLTAIAESFKRTFLTPTARTQGQSVEFYRDPFKLIAIGSIADLADKFTRNEILSSNEVRGIIGFMPADNPRADELVNKNIAPTSMGEEPYYEQDPAEEYYPDEEYPEEEYIPPEEDPNQEGELVDG